MGSRRVYCFHCHKYMGEIRDASLRKGLQVACLGCVTAINAMTRASKYNNGKDGFEGVDIFKDIFGKG